MKKLCSIFVVFKEEKKIELKSEDLETGKRINAILDKSKEEILSRRRILLNVFWKSERLHY